MKEIVFRWRERDVRLRDAAEEPRPRADEALVRTLHVGIDGTDEEILDGEHGAPPEGRAEMVLGHEALGVVLAAPEGSGLAEGDRVVPLVRHGCGRCAPCLSDASDLCETGDFVEHGIKGLDGFMRERWTEPPAGLVPVPPGLADLAVLTEPLSVVVKAVEAARHVQRRLPWFGERGFGGGRALVAGTGSLGSLATFLLRDEGMEVWAMDRSPADAPPGRLVRSLGAEHVNARERDIGDVAVEVGGFDLVVEATGAPKVVFDVVLTLRPNGVMAMLGVPPEKAPFEVDGDEMMRRMVTKNQVLFGSVNSARSHYEEALRRLGSFRERWPGAVDDVVTHRYWPEEYEEAFGADAGGVVKKVVDWSGAA